MASLTVPSLSSGGQSSDSDASFLSDLEEVDHMKIGSSNGGNGDQLQFVDSYFRQDSSLLSDNAVDPYSMLEDSVSSTPWERLAEWIHCFCVVTFDLEIGQMIEVLFRLCIGIHNCHFYPHFGFISGNIPTTCDTI